MSRFNDKSEWLVTLLHRKGAYDQDVAYAIYELEESHEDEVDDAKRTPNQSKPDRDGMSFMSVLNDMRWELSRKKPDVDMDKVRCLVEKLGSCYRSDLEKSVQHNPFIDYVGNTEGYAIHIIKKHARNCDRADLARRLKQYYANPVIGNGDPFDGVAISMMHVLTLIMYPNGCWTANDVLDRLLYLLGEDLDHGKPGSD